MPEADAVAPRNGLGSLYYQVDDILKVALASRQITGVEIPLLEVRKE